MQKHLDQIKQIVGPKGWSDDAGIVDPWLTDSRSVYVGKCALFVQPETTAQTAAVMAICHQTGIAVVPQGGNTGRCGGATPDDAGNAILLNMARMNKVRNLDPLDFTMTVEAGCILTSIQNTADSADCLFPLSLGAEGSCMIGGNLASNAGGINVLRYGNTRDLVLGVEVVLPDGRIWNGLRRLRKDNTGYDLKHLFIGSEGTLGVITAAVIKLFPKPVETTTAICALTTLDAALTLLAKARIESGDSLNSFELIPGIAIDCAHKHIHGIRKPLSETPDWAVLFEFSATAPGSDITTRMQNLLESAFEDEIISDATVAQSGQDRADFWRLREAIVEAQVKEGASIKHDVSVPVSLVPDFIRQAGIGVEKTCPGIRPYAFGHVGDGNIHYNLTQPVEMPAEDFLALEWDIHRIVHDITAELGGSFSAEHGVGRLKTGEILRYKEATELELLQSIKQAIDPKSIMNPGKMLPDQ